jgi:hypothetical protein
MVGGNVDKFDRYYYYAFQGFIYVCVEGCSHEQVESVRFEIIIILGYPIDWGREGILVDQADNGRCLRAPVRSPRPIVSMSRVYVPSFR